MLRALSLAWLTVGETDALTLVRAAAESGFGRIGLKVIPNPGSVAQPLAENAPMVAKIRRALSEEGISVLEMGGVWFTPSLDPRQLKPSLEVGAQLGARFVIAAAGDDCRERLTRNIASMCELAEPFGLKVAIEFIAYSPIATLKDACEVSAAIGHPGCGIVIDALHLARSGTRISEIASVPPGSIHLAHLCDAPRVPPADLRAESRAQRLPPGAGELPLFAFMDALPPELPLEVEAPCASLAQLHPIERARRVAAATRNFLESYRAAGRAAGKRNARKETSWNDG